ncbi:hypothetical protein QYM36_010995 [Artemia franciscana]|uniref:Uncharacterized protein n=1 Tax=Artemia franciscana TaxID=6661 RepID=A0AA88HXT1_ARTSF|nr:hypothetical protein QYM36_010995 [Artemia franciscana]
MFSRRWDVIYMYMEIMDYGWIITQLLAILRAAIVCTVLIYNIASILKSRKLKCRCIIGMVSDSVKVCSILYIFTWLPFVISAVINGAPISCLYFCLIQNYVTNSMSMVLLAFGCVVAVQSLQREVSSSVQNRPVVAALFVILCWLVPQALYCFTMKGYDQQLLNDFELVETYYNSTFSPATQGLSVKIGFTVCGIRYSSLAESHYILKYFLIVLPLGGVAATAFLMKYLIKLVRKLTKGTDDKIQLIGSVMEYSCPIGCHKAVPCLGPSLSLLVLWQLIIKPLVLLFWWSQLNSQDYVYVDIGSHVTLAGVAVFSPMSERRKDKPLIRVFNLNSSINLDLVPCASQQLTEGFSKDKW